MSEQSQKLNDFIQGQEDCKEGKPHEAGKSPEYNAGYNFQYFFEESESAGQFN